MTNTRVPQGAARRKSSGPLSGSGASDRRRSAGELRPAGRRLRHSGAITLGERNGQGRTRRKRCERRRIGKHAAARRHAGRSARTQPWVARRPRWRVGRSGHVPAADRRSRRVRGCGKRGEPEPRECRLQDNRIGGNTGGKLPPESARSRLLHGQGTPLRADYHPGRYNSMRRRSRALRRRPHRKRRRPRRAGNCRNIAIRPSNPIHIGAPSRARKKVNAFAGEPGSVVINPAVCGEPRLARSISPLIGDVGPISNQTNQIARMVAARFGQREPH
jgi:hypothetical protein